MTSRGPLHNTRAASEDPCCHCPDPKTITFSSVRQLVGSIERYVEHYNVHKRPFIWTATADSIIQKVARICKVVSGTEH